MRAKLRVLVKRILRKTATADKQEKATLTVLQQAELICARGGVRSGRNARRLPENTARVPALENLSRADSRRVPGIIREYVRGRVGVYALFGVASCTTSSRLEPRNRLKAHRRISTRHPGTGSAYT